MKKYLIPLVSRGFSGDSADNVLYKMVPKEKNIYVMDNHRLALWCWFQEMEKGSRYNLLHIDAHPDMSESALKDFSLRDHDLWLMSLEQYRSAWQNDINSPLFRWDNYLEVFLKNYPESIGLSLSATHHLGSMKTLSEDLRAFDLAKRMNEIFSGKKYINDLSWIVNLDLDYFFSAAPMKLQLFSDDYIESLAISLRLGLESGMIKVLTIALSPECCGSWEKAEAMLEKVSRNLFSC
ncbi:MAG: peptide arginase family protein [Bacteriovorax sp.]